MRLTQTQQLEFTTLFFDALFGLILFFGIDSFLELKSIPTFILYLMANFILIHWWLIFKSAYDVFGTEVTNSTIYIIFGIIEVILLDYVVLLSAAFNYKAVTAFLLALFAVDLIWALIWRYIGEWETKELARVKIMDIELNNTIMADSLMVILFTGVTVASQYLAVNFFLFFLIIAYFVYIVFTFKKHIIDLRIF